VRTVLGSLGGRQSTNIKSTGLTHRAMFRLFLKRPSVSCHRSLDHKSAVFGPFQKWFSNESFSKCSAIPRSWRSLFPYGTVTRDHYSHAGPISNGHSRGSGVNEVLGHNRDSIARQLSLSLFHPASPRRSVGWHLRGPQVGVRSFHRSPDTMALNGRFEGTHETTPTR